MPKPNQTAIFITDAEAIALIAAEQGRRKDKTAARTATKIILEYFLKREHNDPDSPTRRNKREAAAA